MVNKTNMFSQFEKRCGQVVTYLDRMDITLLVASLYSRDLMHNNTNVWKGGALFKVRGFKHRMMITETELFDLSTCVPVFITEAHFQDCGRAQIYNGELYFSQYENGQTELD